MRTKLVFTLLGLMAFATSANAGLAIYSIDLDVRSSLYQHTTPGGNSNVAGAEAGFAAGGYVCSRSLSAVNNIGANQNCGRWYNYAQKISIDLALSANSSYKFQLGTDWGTGGVIYTTPSIANSYARTDDIWWAHNWNNPSEVIDFTLANNSGQTKTTTLVMLGFERCCGGATSLRYAQSTSNNWQIVAVNAMRVAEPGALAVLGLGLLGLFASRRRLS